MNFNAKMLDEARELDERIDDFRFKSIISVVRDMFICSYTNHSIKIPIKQFYKTAVHIYQDYEGVKIAIDNYETNHYLLRPFTGSPEELPVFTSIEDVVWKLTEITGAFDEDNQR